MGTSDNFIGGIESSADALLSANDNAFIVYSYQANKWYAKSVSSKVNADLQEAGIERLENISPNHGIILYLGDIGTQGYLPDLIESLSE